METFAFSKKWDSYLSSFLCKWLILFVKASLDQATIINFYVDSFCHSLGERVNKDKSKVFLSRSIHHSRSSIIRALGISTCFNWGSIWGSPCIIIKCLEALSNSSWMISLKSLVCGKSKLYLLQVGNLTKAVIIMIP